MYRYEQRYHAPAKEPLQPKIEWRNLEIRNKKQRLFIS